jgi:hypothetical protein
MYSKTIEQELYSLGRFEKWMESGNSTYKNAINTYDSELNNINNLHRQSAKSLKSQYKHDLKKLKLQRKLATLKAGQKYDNSIRNMTFGQRFKGHVKRWIPLGAGIGASGVAIGGGLLAATKGMAAAASMTTTGLPLIPLTAASGVLSAAARAAGEHTGRNFRKKLFEKKIARTQSKLAKLK